MADLIPYRRTSPLRPSDVQPDDVDMGVTDPIRGVRYVWLGFDPRPDVWYLTAANARALAAVLEASRRARLVHRHSANRVFRRHVAHP